MKILFLMIKSRRYFDNVDFNTFTFEEEFRNKNGANKLTLCGLILDKFKDELEVFKPVLTSKTNKEELKEFRKKCEEADVICFQPPTQLNSIISKYEGVLLYNIAFEFKEKVRLIVDDAFDIHNLKKSMTVPTSFFNEFNLKRFNNDVDSLYKYIDNINYAYYKSKKLLYVLYNHSIDEIKECYGEISNTIYLGNTISKYGMFKGFETSIKEKSNVIKYAALSPERSIEKNKKYFNYFNITDVKPIGVTEYKNLKKPEALSEWEIFNELKTSKFILSLPIKKPSLSWERRRIVFAMLLNSILIPYGDDAKYLGKPFILPPDILSKSDEELQNIADEQRKYFFEHILSEDDVNENIKKWLS